jgi:hypothetical protein
MLDGLVSTHWGQHDSLLTISVSDEEEKSFITLPPDQQPPVLEHHKGSLEPEAEPRSNG